jgi:hypothetical protein
MALKSWAVATSAIPAADASDAIPSLDSLFIADEKPAVDNGQLIEILANIINRIRDCGVAVSECDALDSLLFDYEIASCVATPEMKSKALELAATIRSECESVLSGGALVDAVRRTFPAPAAKAPAALAAPTAAETNIPSLDILGAQEGLF